MKTTCRARLRRASASTYCRNVFRAARRASFSSSATKTCHPARTTPESDAPTKAGARCTTVRYFPAIRNRCSSIAPARIGFALASTASRAGCASVSASTYHWSVSHGSMRHVRTVAMRDRHACRDRSCRAAPGLPDRRQCASAPRNDPCRDRLPARRHSACAVSVENIDHRQIMPPPDFKVVKIVRGRDFHRAGAFSGSA